MGIFGRLFGRKKDEFGLDKDELGLDKPSYKPMSDAELGLPELDKRSSLPELPADDEDSEQQASPLHGYRPQTLSRSRAQQPLAQQGEGSVPARDVELILSKLDTIRSILTNLDIRISNIEKIAGMQEKDDRRYQW